MRRFLCLVFCLFLPFSASAEVCILFSDLSDSFCASVRTSLLPLLDSAGLDYTVMDAHGSQWTQMDQGLACAGKKPDAVAIQPCEYGSISAARAAAAPLMEAGIPVVFFGRVMYPDESTGKSFFLEQQNVYYLNHEVSRLGTAQGEAAGAYVAAHFAECDLDGDGKISCLVLQGDAMDEDARTRTSTAIASIEKLFQELGLPPLIGPGSDAPLVLADPDGYWSARFAKSELDRMLGHSMPELILCGNDDMAIGAVNALSEKGFNSDLPGEPAIPVYGIDLSPIAQDLLSQGRLYGSVGRNPEKMADMLCTSLSCILKGQDPRETLQAETEDNWKIIVPYACSMIAP